MERYDANQKPSPAESAPPNLAAQVVEARIAWEAVRRAAGPQVVIEADGTELVMGA